MLEHRHPVIFRSRFILEIDTCLHLLYPTLFPGLFHRRGEGNAAATGASRQDRAEGTLACAFGCHYVAICGDDHGT